MNSSTDRYRPGKPVPGPSRRTPPGLRRVMLRFVVVTQLPGLVAVAVLLALHHHEERQRSLEGLVTHAQALALRLDEQVGDIERHLAELAGRVPRDAARLPDFQGEALRARELAGVDRIVLADSAGRSLADTAASPGGPAAGAAGAAEPRAQDEHSAPPRDLVVAVPVQAQGPGHTLVAHLQANRLGAILGAQALPVGWSAVLVDQKGAVVAPSPPAPPPAGGVAGALRSAIATRASGLVEGASPEGVPMVTAFVRLARPGWTAAVSAPRAELHAGVWRSTGYQALAAAALLLFVALVTLRLTRRVLSSVEQLRQQAECLARPDPPPQGQLAFAEAALVSDRLRRTGEAMRDGQARLEAGEQRLRTILQSAQDAIIVCDAADRIALANESARRIFRASEQPLEGQSLQQLLEPDTWAQYLAELGSPGSGKGHDAAVPSRGQGRRLDGTAFPLEYSAGQFTGAAGARFTTLVARDITPRLQQESFLLATRSELERVHIEQQVLMRESAGRQQAIARELHDAIGSSLAGVSLLLGTARTFTSEPEAAVLISRSQEQVTRATEQVREITRGIMPAGEEPGALVATLQQFAAEMCSIPGVSCTLSWRGDLEEVPTEAGGHLFRIVQEATSNALRHGHATHVRITLARADARCRLAVTDDGCGFDPALVPASTSGMGLRSMRTRAGAIGGSFHVSRRRGGGMRVRVSWTAPDEGAGIAAAAGG